MSCTGRCSPRGRALRYQLRLVTTRVNHNTIVYRYRSSYTMSLCCLPAHYAHSDKQCVNSQTVCRELGTNQSWLWRSPTERISAPPYLMDTAMVPPVCFSAAPRGDEIIGDVIFKKMKGKKVVKNKKRRVREREAGVVRRFSSTRVGRRRPSNENPVS